MKHCIVIVLALSMFLPSLQAMNRVRSHTDSDVDYCHFDSKAFRRARIANKLCSKAEKSRKEREKQQHIAQQMKTAIAYIKSPKNQNQLLSPKRVSPSQKAFESSVEKSSN